MRAIYLNGVVKVSVGDITRESVDAIVNAANSSLMGGGGVDGAIHRAGGPAILQECRGVRRTQYPDGLPTGDAIMTTAGALPAKFVIHTVGPVYGQHAGREADLLASCYENSLRVAVDNALSSIAFPAISTGVFGYPLAEAAEVSSAAIERFLTKDKQLTEVRLVFFSEQGASAFCEHNRFNST